MLLREGASSNYLKWIEIGQISNLETQTVSLAIDLSPTKAFSLDIFKKFLLDQPIN